MDLSDILFVYGEIFDSLTEKDLHKLFELMKEVYYIDYRNARPNYLSAFWELVNWDFVSDNLKK